MSQSIKENIIGQRFNMLIVIADAPKKSVSCVCDCGKIVVKRKYDVVHGNTKSCGCHRSKPEWKLFPETFMSWTAAKQRCYNTNYSKYHNYGGRGIKVCDRWLGKNGFINFLEDMGERPEGKTLDRLEVNGDYEKSNCRWATNLEQQNNKRTNHLITHNGKTQSIANWERELSYKPQELKDRILHYSFEEAISIPSTRNGINKNNHKNRLKITRQIIAA